MNQSDVNMQYVEEDTIDLRELWATLMRRKMLLVVVTGLITLLAVVYVLVKQPIYEVKSNILVGFIGDDKTGKSENIADPDVIVKRLNIVFNVEDDLVTEEEFVSEVSSVSINKKLKNFITIKTEGISNNEALKKNNEVIVYLQDLYKPKIEQYIINTKNAILNIEQSITDIDDFEIKNIKEEIRLLKTQKIAKIDEKIAFYNKVSLPSIQKKINFHVLKLNEYTKEINALYKSSTKSSDTVAQTVASVQMLNYQNLILNSQNKIEDLKIEKEIVENEKIVNLKREKKNINSETIRKLEYKINVDLVTKKRNLYDKIQLLTYNMSEQNVQNSKLIGEYVIKDYPVKPKKKLVVVVAFITGLMLSVFLAFFLEFIQAGRKRDAESLS